jgi:hypothetical protein
MKYIALLVVIGLLGLIALAANIINDESVSEDTETVVEGELSTSDNTNVITQNTEAEYQIDPADFLDDSIGEGVINTDLSEVEIAGLLLMREEEKLARDVYDTLGEQWGLPIFSNIARSEETHTEAVRGLLQLFQLPDPVVKDERGVFADSELQALYDTLVAEGSKSLESALKVGATVEDLDIYDLDRLMAQTENEHILSVYRNLQKGSRNHMRAFNSQLVRRGAEYVPAYISQDDFAEIINSPQERGRM